MAESEYFKAVKHTEHLARESRNELRAQTPILQQQSRLLAQQAKSSRSIEFSSRITAVASVAQVAQQQRIIAQQRQLVAQQQESLNLQYREAEEARAHRLAMWRQTADGAAFTEWQQSAEALAAILDDRDARWFASWDAAVARLRADIPQEDAALAWSQHPIVVPPSAKQRAANLWRILSIVAGAIGGVALISAFFNWLRVPFAPYAVGDAIIATLFTLAAGGFAIFALVKYTSGKDLSHLAEAKRLTAERAAAQSARSQARINQYGFDPLYVQPGFAWYRWYIDDGFTGYADAIRAYIQEAQTTFPAAATLPELRLPEIIEPERATLPEQAAALSQFTSEQRALITG